MAGKLEPALRKEIKAIVHSIFAKINHDKIQIKKKKVNSLNEWSAMGRQVSLCSVGFVMCCSRGKHREKMLDGLRKCLQVGQVTDVLRETRNRNLYKSPTLKSTKPD